MTVGIEIQVDFEGRSPVDSDYHGIRQLLQQLFLKSHIDISKFTDIIIDQNYVGSIIIQSGLHDRYDEDDELEDESTVFGITTIVNISKKKNNECVQGFFTHVLNQAENNCTPAEYSKFKSILNEENHSIGFLINERFVNIPAQISVPLFQSLQKEIQSAIEKNMPYQFSHILMIVKLYKQDMGKGKPKEVIFSNSEEEIICKQVVASFEYSVADEADCGLSGNWKGDDESLVPYRKIILFDAALFPNLSNGIKHFIGE